MAYDVVINETTKRTPGKEDRRSVTIKFGGTTLEFKDDTLDHLYAVMEQVKAHPDVWVQDTDAAGRRYAIHDGVLYANVYDFSNINAEASSIDLGQLSKHFGWLAGENGS